MNFTSFRRIDEFLLSPSDALSCLAKSCALDPLVEKAVTKWVKSSSVTLLEKLILANPAAV